MWMDRDRRHGGTGVVLLALILALSLCGQTGAAGAGTGEEGRVVKVAYPLQSGLTDIDPQGDYCGYTYEYLEEIAQYTGWRYEFVVAEDGSDESTAALMDQVACGEIDLMGSMLYSEELGERFDYAESYGLIETVLQVPDHCAGHTVINSQVPQTIRIAVTSLTGSAIDELDRYCEMNLIQPELVLCADRTEQVAAVEQGRADLLLNVSLDDQEGIYTIARFAPKPFYFVMGKNSDPALMEELNLALLSIEQSDPYFSTSLYEEYFTPSNDSVRLSAMEREYVSAVGPVQVGAISNQPPFHRAAEGTGEVEGITADVLHYISEETGLRFEFVFASTTEELYQMMETGACDLIAGITYDYAFAREYGLTMTQPYLSAQYMRVMRPGVGEEGIEGKHLAMPRTTFYRGYTLGEVVWYNTRNDCVNAVNDGEADYTYVDACTAQYFINQPAYWSLEAVPLAYESVNQCFGIPRPADQELMSILNKAIRSISTEEIQAIIMDNTLREKSLPFDFYVRQYPVQTVALLSGTTLLVMALLFLSLYLRVKSDRAAAFELKKRLRVYAMSNDYFLEYSYDTHVLMVTVPTDGDGQTILQYSYDQYKEDEESRPFWELIHARKNGSHELFQQCGDGQHHWLSMALETICRSNGEPSYVIGKIHPADREKEEKQGLQLQANLDGLTGVYNVAAFRKRMERALEHLEGEEKGAFYLIDIDRFKQINDTYGHLKGDEALRQIARILSENVREGDLVGRFGGDEFVVYLTAVRDSRAIGEKCAVFCRIARESALSEGMPLTISIGAVLSAPGNTYEELFQHADQALYQAKNAGRDGFQIGETPNGKCGSENHGK